MANLIVNLPTTAGDGVGAGQDTSALGGRRTITALGTFRGTVIIEVSEDGGTTYAPIWSFTEPDEIVIDFAGNYMRVRRSGVPEISPGTVNVDVAAEGATGDYVTLNVPAGNGAGAVANTIALPGYKTVTVTGTYTGSVQVQISEDNVDFSSAFTFDSGVVIQSRSITAAYMRVYRDGVKEQPGTPVVAVGAVPDAGGGGGGGGSYSLSTMEVSPNASTTDPEVVVNLPDGDTFLENDEINVKNITENAGLISIVPVGAQTIDGESELLIAGPLISVRLNWDGDSNWRVV